MSRLIDAMRHGRVVASIANYTAREIRLDEVGVQRFGRAIREHERNVSRIRKIEQEAYDEIMSRPCDIEENRDLELMMVVSNLTGFRLNRLAYAGRVLP